ncbi:MAG TPA: DNA N-6-adenine-methyltransferase [Polyangiaceae bacterium]
MTKTKQDWRTPPEFIDAIVKRFGRPTFDLAATAGEQIAGVKYHFTPEQDSLRQSWASLRTPSEDEGFASVAFLNPPFANIAPWAQKLTDECRWIKRWTLMLVPASIGTEWYAKHIHGKALVLGLSPRMTFIGADAPYPKDLMLVCVGFGAVGFDTWRWDRAIICSCEDGDIDDPGPGHAEGCPWADPNYGNDVFGDGEAAE